LNEYGYHLVKKFVQKEQVSELVLITDKSEQIKLLNFSENNKIRVDQCWKFNSYLTIFSIVRSVIKSKPDVVLFNLHFLKFGNKKIPAGLGLLTPMILKILGFNTIVILHNISEQIDLVKTGLASNKFQQKIFSAIGTLLTKCLLTADYVAVPFHKYVKVISEKYKADNVILIPYGSFETSGIVNFDLPLGTKKILVFGKFGTHKKVEIVIDAINIIRQNNSEILELVIAGTDSFNAPGYLESIKNKYTNIDGITFMGYVEETNIEHVFADSAVVAFPYTSTKGSSGVLHLAGSYGKAVVMPNIGDFTLLANEEGFKGEFFNPESSHSLAKAIKVLLLNDDYRKQVAKANFNAASSVTMDNVVDLYLQKFNIILN
jgi:glycosyltransferase involved in cell wall biosynthesis